MGLTAKEVAVLELRKDGLTQAEVAKRLKISQAAVSDFEQNAYKKLKDAAETVAYAQSLGIEPPASPFAQSKAKGVRK